MSAKWVRAKQWDDQHLTGALLPLKWVLRVLSSIPLGVCMLVLVAVYGILASVPIGIIAMAPTWAFYGLTLLAAIAMVGVLPAWVIVRVLGAAKVGRAVRWSVGLLMTVGLVIGAAALWHRMVWPHLQYNPVTGSGIEFFQDFVERYKTVQLRRLPYVEMSELEFYAWWPLKWILVIFVVNMVVATIRRIEFSVPRIGVLMVHTGIVVIALGSVYYTANKQEGDMVLSAARTNGTTGRPETGFYDNTSVALWVTRDPRLGWEHRRLEGVPRYNDYNLLAVPGAEMPDWGQGTHEHRDYGPLNIKVTGGFGNQGDAGSGVVDADVSFRVVGYASYADLGSAWTPRAKAALVAPGVAGSARSMREIEAVLDMSDMPDKAPPRKVWTLVPEVPAKRMDGLDLLEIEYTRGMSEERWVELQATLPKGVRHALVVEVPAKDGGAGLRAVYGVEEGKDLAIGQTGYVLNVQQVLERSPFPIITKGYEGASSSLVVVKVTTPKKADGSAGESFDRWVYHRFPEISQDMLPELNERGMQKRRAASSDIRISYIDASRLQAYFDELPSGDVRALVRTPGGQSVVTPGLKQGQQVQVAPKLALRLGERAEDVVQVEVPRVTPPDMRQKELVGNHKAAAIAVEVKDKGGVCGVVWLAFTQYMQMGQDTEREVTLSDGRRVTMAFGRVRHEFFPAMGVALKDFEMIPYPHSDTPRDYRSDVVVRSNWNGEAREATHSTSLNAPLLVRTPFVKREGVSGFVNLWGWAMSLIAPNQYKFAQAGWDASGWRESVQMVARGEAARPSARFTILGVGNNPGIYIIATGAVLMSVGVPWAFYLKPWLIQRQKRKLAAAVARGEIKPGRGAKHGGGVNGSGGASAPGAGGHDHQTTGAGT